jgi:uncharacterized membrane protein YbhN (UPF0104 family)
MANHDGTRKPGRTGMSRWARPLLLAIALGFCGYALRSQWPQAVAAFGRLRWYWVGLAGLTALAGSGCFMLAWRALLADLGSPLPAPAAVRVMFVAQLAKYVPGMVWAFAAQVELGRDHGVPRRRGGAAVLIGLGLTLGTGLAAALAMLPFSSAAAVHRYWWALMLIPVIAVALCPPVLARLLRWLLVLVRQPPLGARVSAAGMARAACWTGAGWLLWGLQAWLLVRQFAGDGVHVLVLSLGGYALAWSVGLLLVVFPGGLGPRELAFVAVLGPVLPHGTALVAALVSRVLMTLTDLAWGGTGLMLHRPAREPVPLQMPLPGPLGADSQTS